tara:strand:- start:148 stop:363 length:216 start_codon:yes stop_codon:yes gene_type:complete
MSDFHGRLRVHTLACVCVCTNAVEHRVHGRSCAPAEHLEEEGAEEFNHVGHPPADLDRRHQALAVLQASKT